MFFSKLAIKTIALDKGKSPPVLAGNDSSDETHFLPLYERVYKISKQLNTDYFHLEELPSFSKLPFAGGFNLYLPDQVNKSGYFHLEFDLDWGLMSLENKNLRMVDQEEAQQMFVFDLEKYPLEFGMFAKLPGFLLLMSPEAGPGLGPKARLPNLNNSSTTQKE